MVRNFLFGTCVLVLTFEYLSIGKSEEKVNRSETPVIAQNLFEFKLRFEVDEDSTQGAGILEDTEFTTDIGPLIIEPFVIPNILNSTDILVGNQNQTARAICQCGRPSHRIVGGETASINEYPWTAALTRGGSRLYCGGTLINNLYVVTASHCVDGMSAKGVEVVLNQENVYSSPQAQRYLVSQITMHSSYDRRVVDNDIALLRLSKPVRLDQGSIVPVCLPATNKVDFAGVPATVAGWGATAQGASTSNILRKVTVPVLSNTQCNRESRYKGKITDNMMCAGILSTGGKDSCQGDSGGPLIIENGGRRTLIGIVSWGYGCAQALSPGVYTRVGRYPEWILENTKDAEWCLG